MSIENQKCPNCQSQHYSVGPCYFEPVFKDGVSIKEIYEGDVVSGFQVAGMADENYTPDRNQTTADLKCHDCHNEWRAIFTQKQ